MGRKRHTPEQIITALREAEVGLAGGKSVKLISRELGRDEGEPGTAPEASSGGLDTGQADPGGSGQGKLLSPERRRRCVARVRPAARGVGEESVPGARAATHDPAPGEESGE